MKLFNAIALIAAFAVTDVAAFGNPDNPLDFCGRVTTSTGGYDPYYKDAPEEEEALAAAAAPRPTIDVRYPGDPVVVDGVAGVLGERCKFIPGPQTSGDPHFTTWVRVSLFWQTD